MSEAELDRIQALFEDGEIMQAAREIHRVCRRERETESQQEAVELERMVAQMRAYLEDDELREFEQLSGSDTKDGYRSQPSRHRILRIAKWVLVSVAAVFGVFMFLLVAPVWLQVSGVSLERQVSPADGSMTRRSPLPVL
jgi:hypothetical protein